MVITKPGKYTLIEDYTTRNSVTISTIPKGTVIEITQIDFDYHKVIGKDFLDWAYWELPVKGVK